MKYLLISFISVLCTTPIYAQQSNQDSNEQTLNKFINHSNVIYTKTYSNVKGSPFYLSDWESGRILLKTGNKSKMLQLKYNTYKNKLLFKKGGKIYELSTDINGFVFHHKGQKILFKNGFNSSKNKINPSLFLQIIYDGKIKLVKRNYTLFHKANRVDPISGKKTSVFIKETQIYLISPNGQFHKVKKLKRKYILGALESHKNELKTYAHSKELDFGDQNDLKKILGEYDKMLQKP